MIMDENDDDAPMEEFNYFHIAMAATAATQLLRAPALASASTLASSTAAAAAITRLLPGLVTLANACFAASLLCARSFARSLFHSLARSFVYSLTRSLARSLRPSGIVR